MPFKEPDVESPLRPGTRIEATPAEVTPFTGSAEFAPGSRSALLIQNMFGMLDLLQRRIRRIEILNIESSSPEGLPDLEDIGTGTERGQTEPFGKGRDEPLPPDFEKVIDRIEAINLRIFGNADSLATRFGVGQGQEGEFPTELLQMETIRQDSNEIKLEIANARQADSG